MPFQIKRDDKGDVSRVEVEVAHGRYAGLYEVEFAWPDNSDEPYFRVAHFKPDHFDLDGRPMRWSPIGEWHIPASAAITPSEGTMTYAEMWKRLRMPGSVPAGADELDITVWKEDGLIYELAGIMGWRMARGVARRFA